MSDDCTCEFDFAEPDGGATWHYARTCPACGETYGAMHCEHEPICNPTPCCGYRYPGKPVPAEVLAPRAHGWFFADENSGLQPQSEWTSKLLP